MCFHPGKDQGLQAPGGAPACHSGAATSPQRHAQPLWPPPVSQGTGTADGCSAVSQSSGSCEGPAGGKHWGLFGTDGSVRFGSRKSCKTCDTWRDCRGLGSPGGLGGQVGGAQSAQGVGDPACPPPASPTPGFYERTLKPRDRAMTQEVFRDVLTPPPLPRSVLAQLFC